MSIEFGRVFGITKKRAGYSSGAAMVAVALLTSGCGADTESSNFPPCTVDPQTKSKTMEVSDGGFFNSDTVDHIANVDGVTFNMPGDKPRRIDIEADENRVKILEEGHVQFEGLSDGRLYDVIFPVDFDGSKIRIDIEAICK